MGLGPGAAVGLLASGGVSVYCVARLTPSASTVPWARRAELSHVLMGVVMAAMLVPPFLASRAPWTAAAVAFGALALVHAGRLRVRASGPGHHLAHVVMLAAMAFMLVTMPPLRGAPTGVHARHLRAALGADPGSPVAAATMLCFAVLLALCVERAVAVALLRSARPVAPGGRLRALVLHPAGLAGCDAVMCAVMAGMFAPML